jgi:hypothetical protein
LPNGWKDKLQLDKRLTNGYETTCVRTMTMPENRAMKHTELGLWKAIEVEVTDIPDTSSLADPKKPQGVSF